MFLFSRLNFRLGSPPWSKSLYGKIDSVADPNADLQKNSHETQKGPKVQKSIARIPHGDSFHSFFTWFSFSLVQETTRKTIEKGSPPSKVTVLFQNCPKSIVRISCGDYFSLVFYDKFKKLYSEKHVKNECKSGCTYEKHNTFVENCTLTWLIWRAKKWFRVATLVYSKRVCYFPQCMTFSWKSKYRLGSPPNRILLFPIAFFYWFLEVGKKVRVATLTGFSGFLSFSEYWHIFLRPQID